MKLNEMNKHQKTACLRIMEEINWIIGGYENAISDGHIEKMPTREDLIQEIYGAVTSDGAHQDVVKEIRLAGKKFIIERIEKRLVTLGIKESGAS